MADWEPELYNRFRRYRAEPFEAIMRRLVPGDRERIVDLGCGSGENTVELARRSEHGSALGLDSSPAMIDRANKLRAGLEPSLAARIRFAQADIRDFAARDEYSVIFSNAAFHWLTDHRPVFRACFRALVPGGRIVVQMPANDEETAKLAIRELARENQWRAKLGDVEDLAPVAPPEAYRAMLTELGFTDVDCYYYTFEHPMSRPAEVVEWYKSTGLRPFLDPLAENEQARFLQELTARLNSAYATDGAMVFHFRRLFIWARRLPA